MNKHFLLPGILTITVLAGCQNINKSMETQLVEGLLNTMTQGEAQFDIKDLEQGKVDIKTKDGTISIDGNEGKKSGSVKMTDNTGKTVAEMQGSEVTSTRPADAPADMPSPNNAVSFNYFKYNQIHTLNYQLPSTDLKASCDKVKQMIANSGWKIAENNLSFQTNETISQNYENDKNNLVLICTKKTDSVNVDLQKDAKTK